MVVDVEPGSVRVEAPDMPAWAPPQPEMPIGAAIAASEVTD
jgi:hypothetical protein